MARFMHLKLEVVALCKLLFGDDCIQNPMMVPQREIPGVAFKASSVHAPTRLELLNRIRYFDLPAKKSASAEMSYLNCRFTLSNG